MTDRPEGATTTRTTAPSVAMLAALETTRYVREIPLNFNGYAAVAARAEQIPASDVRAGDVLLLDGYVSLVSDVRLLDLANRNGAPINTSEGRWAVLHIQGDLNIVRFPQELLSVLRGAS